MMIFYRPGALGVLLVVSVAAQSGDGYSDVVPSFSAPLRSTSSTGSDLPTSSADVLVSSLSPTASTQILAPAFTADGTPSSPTPSMDPQSMGPSIDPHALTITLAVCLSALGLILLFIAFLLARRYRIGRSPFRRSFRRGATPIDDDEIATWRGNAQSMAKVPYTRTRDLSSVVVAPAGGRWATPTSNPSDPLAGVGELPPLPPVVARAPNARSGLTDEAVPGAVPFVTAGTRDGRRLSKMGSAGHIRTKSGRMNVTVNAIPEPRPSMSRSPWVEPEDWAVQGPRSDSSEKMPKPRSAVDYDDEKPGGLAPRPSRRSKVSLDELPGAAF